MIAEAALVVSAITDPNASAEAVAREFEGKYDLHQIKNPVSRKRLEDALEYRRNMLKLARQHSGAMRDQLQQTIADVNDWIGQMYDVALHIDNFESNDLVERDRRMVPQQLEKVQIRLKQETDPGVQKDLREQADRLQLQLDNLNSDRQQRQARGYSTGQHALVARHDLRADVAARHERRGQQPRSALASGHQGRGVRLAGYD